MNKKGYIYQIINTYNNKIYIGSTINLCARWKEHINDLSKNKHHNIHLQRAWIKYGRAYFKFSIIEIVENTGVLLEREDYWLENSKCFDKKFGYNIKMKATGGELPSEVKNKISNSNKGKNKGNKNFMYGKTHTVEAKEKISKTHKGRVLTEEHKCKIGNSVRGKKYNFSIEHRRNLSESFKGRIVSDKTRKILSQKLSGNNSPRKKITIETVYSIYNDMQKGLILKQLTKKYKSEPYNCTYTIIRNIYIGKTWVNDYFSFFNIKDVVA